MFPRPNMMDRGMEDMIGRGFGIPRGGFGEIGGIPPFRDIEIGPAGFGGRPHFGGIPMSHPIEEPPMMGRFDRMDPNCMPGGFPPELEIGMNPMMRRPHHGGGHEMNIEFPPYHNPPRHYPQRQKYEGYNYHNPYNDKLRPGMEMFRPNHQIMQEGPKKNPYGMPFRKPGELMPPFPNFLPQAMQMEKGNRQNNIPPPFPGYHEPYYHRPPPLYGGLQGHENIQPFEGFDRIPEFQNPHPQLYSEEMNPTRIPHHKPVDLNFQPIHIFPDPDCSICHGKGINEKTNQVCEECKNKRPQ